MTRIDISQWSRRLRNIDRAALVIPVFGLMFVMPLALFLPPPPPLLMLPELLLSAVAGYLIGGVVALRFIAGSKATAAAVLAVSGALVALFGGGMAIIHVLIVVVLVYFAVRGAVPILSLARNGAPRQINDEVRRCLGESSTSMHPGLGLPLRALPSQPAPLWSLLATALLLVGLGLLLAPHPGPAWMPYAQNAVAFALLGLGGGAYVRGQRAAAAGAAEAMAKDPRAPILYLRSFQDDGLAVGAQRIFFLNPLRLCASLWGGGRAIRFEETLAAELGAYGPVVGIGQPNEALPQLGAARWYESDATWQAGIDALLPRAQLIVVSVARTDGLAWEISRIEQLGLWPRVVFVLPPVDPQEARLRWQHVCSSVRDPRLQGHIASLDFDGVGAVVHLDDERTLAVAAKKWRQIEYQLAMKLVMTVLTHPSGSAASHIDTAQEAKRMEWSF